MSTHQTMGDPTKNAVTVRGYDLTTDLIGHVTFTELFWLELIGSLPDAATRDVLDAILVALTEHGLTPTAVVARLTDLGAPGAIQGAVAAGLLGAGERFLGALDGCARILAEWPASGDDATHADRIVAELKQSGQRVPGLGHPTHTDGDPRVDALYSVASSAGVAGQARNRLDQLRRAAETAANRQLPINVDGACGALLVDLGLPWQVARGVALVARSAGLVGHVWDEQRHPAASAIWAAAEQTAPYRAPIVE